MMLIITRDVVLIRSASSLVSTNWVVVSRWLMIIAATAVVNDRRRVYKVLIRVEETVIIWLACLLAHRFAAAARHYH